MRILQLIDSLEAGGAEMMAVNYANTLYQSQDFSGLVATRKEGSLKTKISPDLPYLFLERKRTLDFKAVIKLKEFCKLNKVDFLHAHSSSYAIACMVKLIYPGIKIIWHDHDGMSEFLQHRKGIVLKIASYFFSGIITVNELLKKWDVSNLNCRHVIYLPNFSMRENEGTATTQLHGNEGKRILCLANLRPQKNHQLIIEIALKLKLQYPEWSFHLIGKDFNDDYAFSLKTAIEDNNLSHYIYIYGTKNDISNVISQADICILTSLSEGLPVSLLEYGFHKKPVVVTAVGEVGSIVENGISGYLVESDHALDFSEALIKLMEDSELRTKFGENLFTYVKNNNSDTSVIYSYQAWLKMICHG